MDGLVTIRISDLDAIFKKLEELKAEIKEIKEKDDLTTALSIEQVAQRLNIHYCSARTLILKGHLFAKYLHGDYGKCMVPLWSLKEYLSKKENSNQ